MSKMYLRLLLIFPTKFHPDPSTLSVFHDFRFPPNSPQCHQILSEFKIRSLRHDILLNINFTEMRTPVRKLRIPHFSKFSELTLPPPHLPQKEWIRSDYVNHVSRTCAYFSHQVSSRYLHSKCFLRL